MVKIKPREYIHDLPDDIVIEKQNRIDRGEIGQYDGERIYDYEYPPTKRDITPTPVNQPDQDGKRGVAFIDFSVEPTTNTNLTYPLDKLNKKDTNISPTPKKDEAKPTKTIDAGAEDGDDNTKTDNDGPVGDYGGMKINT